MALLICILIAILLLLLAASFLLCWLAFSVPKSKKRKGGVPALPKSAKNNPHRDEAIELIKQAMEIPYEDVWITSYDGLRLHGKYYHTKDGAPLQMMFHGYRSSSAKDFGGGLMLALRMGYNALLVDQRAHGESEGRLLTMGVCERRDCLSWVRFAVQRFGQDTEILLLGMSMGASTVLMAAELDLPGNVKGIIADCGYTSPEAIVKKILRNAGGPVGLSYRLLCLGCRLFGKFDLESASAVRAMEQCTIPVLFIHGEADNFVPCDMSRENFSHCASPEKRLFTVPEAGHGFSFLFDRAGYTNALQDFEQAVLEHPAPAIPI